MKRLIILILFLNSVIIGQSIGNEWINYNQEFFYVPITEKGVYRVSYQTLLNNGFPVNTINPKNIQVFAKEKEQTIYISGEEDNIFNSTDFIEFYAEGNDGWLDSLTYSTPEQVTNPYYSLYNDTINYYITFNNSTNNKRVIIENSQDYQSYSTPNYLIRKSTNVFSSRYYFGEKDQFAQSSPYYTSGEGWFATQFNKGSTFTSSHINLGNIYEGLDAPQVIINSNVASTSNANTNGGLYNHHLQVEINGNTVYNQKYYGYQLTKLNELINVSELSNTTSIRFKSIDDLGVASDYQAVSYSEIIYPHTLNFSGETEISFELNRNQSQNKTRVGISGLTGNTFLAYSLGEDVYRMNVISNSGLQNISLPNQLNGESSKVYFLNTDAIRYVSKVFSVSNNNRLTDYAQANISDAYIIITNKLLKSSVDQYNQYRTSRGEKTLVVDVAELYHQYGGGINKHALAIKRFITDLKSSLPSPPRAIFIIGKGIREATETSGGTNPGTRKSESVYAESLVPSFGYPSSDAIYTTSSYTDNPSIPIGRLAARNNQEVTTYLNKVIAFEQAQDSPYTLENKLWMKQILHFGGGGTTSEQNTFKAYLNSYKNIIENKYYGGNVTSYFKSSSDPIDAVNSKEISDIIKGGTSLMCFFGHASGTGFDANVDSPSEWGNKGKYPLVIGNSCYTGDIYQPSLYSASEEFVLTPDAGAIGFISSVKVGISSYLNAYTTQFYNNLSVDNYNQSIGELSVQTINDLLAISNSWAYRNTALGMTIHADPVLKVNTHDKPDYAIESSSFDVTPNELSVSVDSLLTNLKVYNIGKAVDGLFSVNIDRYLPDNQSVQSNSTVLGDLFYKDSVQIKFPVKHEVANGLNTFNIQVDLPLNEIDEEDNQVNNQINAYPLLITSEGVEMIYPYPFSIISENKTKLIVNTNNFFEEEKNYLFEVDTTNKFNSTFKYSTQLMEEGGVISVDLPLTLSDSVVYYWRCRPEDVSEWNESSFQYILGKEGYGQSHYQQFLSNKFQQLFLDSSSGRYSFNQEQIGLEAQVFGNAGANIEYNQTYYRLGGEVIEQGGCGTAPSFHVAILEPNTLEPWGTYGYYPGTTTYVNVDHQFGNLNNDGACRSRTEKYFIFRQNNAAQLDAFYNMLKNEVPNGYYILVYSWQRAQPSNWSLASNNIVQLFQDLGANQVASLNSEVPFIFLTKQGSPSDTEELLGNISSDIIRYNKSLLTSGDNGSMQSPLFGPLKGNNDFYWNGSGDIQDSISVQLTKYAQNAIEDLVLDTNTFNGVSNVDVDGDFSPKFRIKGDYIDTLNVSPFYQRKWYVTGDHVPEFTFVPKEGYYLNKDTLQEGEELILSIPIKNISKYNGDSILVKYWVEGNEGVKYIPYPKQDSLFANTVLKDTIYFNTTGLEGLNSIWVEINPMLIQPYGFDQLEQNPRNNLLQIPFYVEKDNTNPLLDVTFDGVHILDGDIVSAQPEIVVVLEDENLFMLMNEESDTSNFKLYVTSQNDLVQKRVFFNSNHLEFIPASGNKNRPSIIYTPDFEIDGTYELLVQATDKSGNRSSSIDYKISFEVINKSTITQIFNYPNPFTTKTHFVFTLTGSQLPDDIFIQIVTISGKIVREIYMDELGPIRIGHNKTEFAWDGTDQYGDRLANGVYLYRVEVKMNGEDIEQRQTSADYTFKNGWGKMMLLK